MQFMMGDGVGGAGSGNGDAIIVKMRTWNGAYHKP